MNRTFLLSVLFVACGAEFDAPATSSAPLDEAFELAAREFQVPVPVLKSLGWVQTRHSITADLTSSTGGVGLMQLTRRDDWDTLGEAARLTGVTEGRLRIDPNANIRGAAAVLRGLFDRLDDSRLNGHNVGDWFDAVALYPGFTSATMAAEFAGDVFGALERGFDGQPPLASNWRDHAPQASRVRQAAIEYPGAAAWLASPHFTPGRSATIDRVLVHTMQGYYAGTKSWFTNPTSKVSSHYIVRSSDGEITQMVAHANTAWHAQCYNPRSVGIEHEGFVQNPGTWYTENMYRESGKLTAYICNRHNIPKTRAHIIGHNEVPSSCNTGGHTDPGSGWNWSKYMGYVTGTTTPPPTQSTGVFIGTIYVGTDTTARVAGATVKIGSNTTTTNATGVYQFTLAPGSYTATVSKSGYTGNSVTRTVTAGAQVWGSMSIEVVPVAPATGTFIGVIYTGGNTADKVPGATVKVGNKTVVTGADGVYSFDLAPGEYTATVTKSGFVSTSVTRTVTANQSIWGSMNINPTQTDAAPPVLAITFPATGLTLDLGRITLKGTATNDGGPLANVSVSLNGGAATGVPVSSGQYEVELQLKPGSNTITVTGTDAAGNTASKSSTVTYLAGVAGFVTLADDETTRLDGATVTLRETGSGTVVTEVTTDAAGAYVAPVLTVPADYVVTVAKAGYRTSSQTVSVPEEQRLSLDVALWPGEDEAEEAELAFLEPVDGAVILTDSVIVYGRVSGFDLASVEVNGRTAELVGAGGFAISLPLVPGDNAIEAIATGVTGQTVASHMTVKYQPSGGNNGGGDENGNGSGDGKGSKVPTPSFVPKSSCAAVGGEAIALLALLGLARRRSRR